MNNDMNTRDSIFTCSLCEIRLTKIDDLYSHMFEHVTEAPFECPDCADVFEELTDYLNHIQLHSAEDIALTNSKKQETGKCSQKFRALDNHEIHTDEQSKQTKSENLNISKNSGIHNLLPLEWQKRDNKQRLYECKLCQRSFTLASTLNLHNRRIHLNIKPFECAVCKWNFAQSSDLIRHMRKHTNNRPYKCSYCKMTFTQNRNMKNHMKMHQTDPSTCKYCNKSFAIDTSLAQHLKKHEGTDAVECEFCKIPYVNDNDMKMHRKRMHSDGKNYKCVICFKAFAKSCDLNKHKRIHSNEKPFKCLICSKCFTHPTSLRNHKAVHTNEKPFQCSFCGKSFAFSGNLKVHIRSHTNEKPFTCNFCGKNFARTANLNEHLKIHTGEKSHKCDVCGKAFTNSSTFSKHKKIHTGQRAHKCTICNKTFIQRAHLAKHLKTHTGEKPYECIVCNKFFRRSDTLASHMKTHRLNNSTTPENLIENADEDEQAYENMKLPLPLANESSEIQISGGSIDHQIEINSEGQQLAITNLPNTNFNITNNINSNDQLPVTVISYQQLLQWSANATHQ